MIDIKNLHAASMKELFETRMKDCYNVPKIIYTHDANELKNSDLYAILLLKDQSLDDLNLPFTQEEKEHLYKYLEQNKFVAKKDKFIKLSMMVDNKFADILVYGLDELSKIELSELITLGKKFCITANKLKVKNTSVIYNITQYDKEIASKMGLGLMINNYHFNLKNKKPLDDESTSPDALNEIKFLVDKENIDYLNKHSKENYGLAKSINITKVYCDAPANLIYPESLANYIKADLKALKVEVEILETEQMEKLGMGALLAVGQAATFTPRLIVMKWMNGAKGEQPVAFVGKGITFDSGGLSIKPADSMGDMKYDMTGASVVAGTIRSLAERNAKINAIGVIGVAENSISGNAMRPGDVVMSMSGQTIEVLNTDAEGRLVLADVLTYTQKFFKPKIIIDLATLTGAAIVALGTNTNAAILSNNSELAAKLLELGKSTGETLWRLPLEPMYNKRMDSKIADMQNIGNGQGKGAGTITAAEFLQRFIDKDVKWAHLDIAGVDHNASNTESELSGSTAFGVNLLNEFSKQYEG